MTRWGHKLSLYRSLVPRANNVHGIAAWEFVTWANESNMLSKLKRSWPAEGKEAHTRNNKVNRVSSSFFVSIREW